MSIRDQASSRKTSYKPPIMLGKDAGPVEDLDSLLGRGDDLWTDDADFEAFLAALRRWRKQDRDESLPR